MRYGWKEFMYNSQKTAQNILDICKKRGITVKRLEEIADINSQHGNLTYKIKNGDVTNIKTFCAIANALNVKLDDIIDNSEPYNLFHD